MDPYKSRCGIKAAIALILAVTLVCVVFQLQPNLGRNKMQYNVVVEATFDTPFGERHSIGSGVVISDTGMILTAAHVINGARSVRITLHDGRVFGTDEFYTDAERDVGFVDLELPYGSIDFMPLSESDDIEKGCLVVHVGNPNGIWTDTIVRGKIYNPHFFRLSLGKDIEFIVVKMEIRPGCSGGGVYLGDELIGIVKAYWDGAAIIIPSGVCRLVLEKYRVEKESTVVDMY